jgi:hypothetical protein
MQIHNFLSCIFILGENVPLLFKEVDFVRVFYFFKMPSMTLRQQTTQIRAEALVGSPCSVTFSVPDEVGEHEWIGTVRAVAQSKDSFTLEVNESLHFPAYDGSNADELFKHLAGENASFCYTFPAYDALQHPFKVSSMTFHAPPQPAVPTSSPTLSPPPPRLPAFQNILPAVSTVPAVFPSHDLVDFHPHRVATWDFDDASFLIEQLRSHFGVSFGATPTKKCLFETLADAIRLTASLADIPLTQDASARSLKLCSSLLDSLRVHEEIKELRVSSDAFLTAVQNVTPSDPIEKGKAKILEEQKKATQQGQSSVFRRFCEYCRRSGHTEAFCNRKRADNRRSGRTTPSGNAGGGRQ